jgi:outer membrane protein OmpA-like peptidoglycan-associated protein
MGMKWSVLKTAFATVVISALLTPAFCQNYYLVIGAFATENDNVREFTSFLPGQSMDTAYTTYSNNNMMHFYVMKTSSKDLLLARSMKVQQEIENGGQVHTLLNGPAQPEQLAGLSAPGATGSSGLSSAASSATGSAPVKPKGKFFKFTIAKENGELLPAQVHQIDLSRGRDLASYTAGTNVDLLHPASSEPLALVCGVFGYKEVEKLIDYSNPAVTAGAYVDDDGAWVIPYTLERIEKGDVSVMYNVSFHKDAVIMQPSSRNDLDELVNMMQQNPNYVIKVHAHCNGKKPRKILALGENDNYFDIQSAVEMEASAKTLTKLRAEAIRSYLALHDISSDRVKIYGWGGAEMLVDEDDPNAKQLNDRIEIEVLED